MANITSKNNTTNATVVVKENETMTTVNRIVNRTINITAAPHANIVTLAKRAGTTYLKLNDFIAGAIGGSAKDQERNVRCIQFMVDNCDENTDGRVLAFQCGMFTQVMANLEGIPLDDVVTIDGQDCIIHSEVGKVYNEMGEKILDIRDMYPQLIGDIEMSDEAIRAILIGELNNRRAIEEVAEESDKEGDTTIDIKGEGKLSVIDTIKGLRALGMTASWYNVDGVKQLMPICYNGESDIKAFTKVVEDSLKNNTSYLDTILVSCRLADGGINPDEEIININCLEYYIDYKAKRLYDKMFEFVLANLDDIDCNLPREAVKVMLIERGKEAIEEMRKAAEAYLEEEDDYDDYDEYDEEDDPYFF